MGWLLVGWALWIICISLSSPAHLFIDLEINLKAKRVDSNRSSTVEFKAWDNSNEFHLINWVRSENIGKPKIQLCKPKP